MNEDIAIILANRIAQLELDKATLMSDLAVERKMRAELEARLSRLEVNDAKSVPAGEVASTE